MKRYKVGLDPEAVEIVGEKSERLRGAVASWAVTVQLFQEELDGVLTPADWRALGKIVNGYAYKPLESNVAAMLVVDAGIRGQRDLAKKLDGLTIVQCMAIVTICHRAWDRLLDLDNSGPWWTEAWWTGQESDCLQQQH